MEIIEKIAQKINQAGGRCFYVGGYVRDKLLGKENVDIDIEVFHLTLEALSSILQEFGEVETFGKAFGILKIRQLPNIDFALPRKERKIGDAHTDFEIMLDKDLPYIEAARRRDFTCNAIMEDVLTGEILDYFSGIGAIQNKILRYVDATTFVEDPLRGLRAAQFATRFQFEIDLETTKLIQTLDYSNLSIERIQSEFQKGLKAKNTVAFFNILYTLNITEKLFNSIYLLQQQNIYTKLKSVLSLIDKNISNDINRDEHFIIYFTACILYVNSPKALLKSFTSNKKIQKSTLKLRDNLLQTKHCITPTEMRHLKNTIEFRTLYFFLLEQIAINDCTILPQNKDFQVFQKDFIKAIENNPSTVPLIQGRDLIALGFTPNENFNILLQEALQLEEMGRSKEEIKLILSKKLLV